MQEGKELINNNNNSFTYCRIYPPRVPHARIREGSGAKG
jgi:hypothetical protein